MHMSRGFGGTCPAYNATCDFCKNKGHYKKKCKKFKNQQKGGKPKGDTKDNAGEEAHEVWVCDSDLTEQAKTMEWGGGDLSLIKGVSGGTRDPGGSSSTCDMPRGAAISCP